MSVTTTDQTEMQIVWPFADVEEYLGLEKMEKDGSATNQHDLSVLVLEGNIAAGKSTMVKRLGEIRDDGVVRVVTEPLPPPKCLSALYMDRQKHTCTAQLFFLYHRALEVLKVWLAHLLSESASIMILDRGFVGDSLFAEMLAEEGSITEEEMVLYRELSSTITDVLPPFSATWMLWVSTEDCLKRVAKRDRQGEAAISLDYLSRLGDAHARMETKGLTQHVLSNSDCGEEEAIKRAQMVLQTAAPITLERSSLTAFQRAVKVISCLKPRFERN